MVTQLNLATFYLLPLIELSKSSFGDIGDMDLKTRLLLITDKSNLINAYLSTENYIVVKVRDITKVPDSSLAIHNYFSDIDIEEDGIKSTLILYRVDKPYLEDLAKFRKGQYSRMRDIAKDKIVMFNDMDTEMDKVSNRMYAALYRSSWLRNKLEDELDTSISEEMELIPLPNPNNYLDLSANFKEVSTL